MNKPLQFLALTAIAVGLIVSCGPGGPIGPGGDDDDDDTNTTASETPSGSVDPTASPSPPNPNQPTVDTFQNTVLNNISGGNNCNCHANGGSAAMVIYPGSTQTVEVLQSYNAVTCCPRMFSYDTVTGFFFESFCNGPGDPKNPPSHPEPGYNSFDAQVPSGNHPTQSATFCTNWYNWQLEGNGVPEDKCFLTNHPSCP